LSKTWKLGLTENKSSLLFGMMIVKLFQVIGRK